MSIHIKKQQESHILHFEDELTIQNALELQKVLLQSLAETQELILDLSGITAFDSAGVQLLLALQKEALQRAKTIQLKNPTMIIASVFELYELDTVEHVASLSKPKHFSFIYDTK